MEDQQHVKAILVTANTGSIFEDPSRLLQVWITEFCEHIRKHRPEFVALHLQEVGGKTYEKSLEYVQEFIKLLCEAEEFADFNRIRVYLDEDYSSAEHFTALGNLYFASKNIKQLDIWNFLTHEWEQVEGKNIHTGNIESVPTKEKSKFPQNFFPECKWSRKGFMRTRWNLNGSVFDLVNIHLFHDASNLAACQEYPSVYCKSRRRALLHTLERFHKDKLNEPVPYFIFGDFNFRVDTAGVIKELTENLTVHRIQNVKSDNTKVQYRDSDGANVLTVGKKEFSHAEHQTKFKEDWLRNFDLELEPIHEILHEYPITFPPSYPYEEDVAQPQHYMSTRCPSWCDRVLVSPAAKRILCDSVTNPVTDAITDNPIYNIIGRDICMGDHKPVYLSIRIKIDQGIVRCWHADPLINLECTLAAQNIKLQNIKLQTVTVTSSLRKHHCNVCREQFETTLSKLYKLDRTPLSICPRGHTTTTHENIPRPKISINVIDTENLSVCMCSLYNSRNNSDDNLLRSVECAAATESNTICPICRNIIKKQPSERITLTSKRLLLANDIIVNRIDSHYLNTFSGINLKQDPYTPESPDSFSPLLDTDSSGSNRGGDVVCTDETELIETDNAKNSSVSGANNNNHFGVGLSIRSSGGVSPRQLKSRLESLRRLTSPVDADNDEDNTTTTMTLSEVTTKDEEKKFVVCPNSKNNSDDKEPQCCSSKSCSIL